MGKYTALDDALHAYLQEVSAPEHPLLAQLRRESEALPEAEMLIAPEQGQFLQLLVRLTGATRIVEAGCFTGYSSLAMALALPPEGHLLTCDTSEQWTRTARRFWREAGVAGKIELKLGPARETLEALLREGQAGSFDMAFIDADKVSYPAYYERCLDLLRPGGLLLADNTLYGGRPVRELDRSEGTEAIRAFNTTVRDDSRVEHDLLPLADGLTLARKK